MTVTTPPHPTRAPVSVRALLPHLVWEGVLLVLLLVVAGAAAALTEMFSRSPWSLFAVGGLTACALSFSLRTGWVNLAIGTQAALAGALFARLAAEDLPPIAAGSIALLVVVLIGAVIGLVAGVTSAPGWAVSLGALAALIAANLALSGTGFTAVPDVGVFGNGGLWFVIFVLISLAGGVLWLLPRVRALTAGRGDPVSFAGRRLLAALIGYTGSSLLAGLAGLVLVGRLRSSSLGNDIGMLLTALGVVLFAGVSVYGGRGGVAGVVLVTVIAGVVSSWLAIEGASSWAVSLVPAAILILLGLGVSRLLEAIGGTTAPPGRAAPYGPATPAPAPVPGYGAPAAGYGYGPPPGYVGAPAAATAAGAATRRIGWLRGGGSRDRWEAECCVGGVTRRRPVAGAARWSRSASSTACTVATRRSSGTP